MPRQADIRNIQVLLIEGFSFPILFYFLLDVFIVVYFVGWLLMNSITFYSSRVCFLIWCSVLILCWDATGSFRNAATTAGGSLADNGGRRTIRGRLSFYLISSLILWILFVLYESRTHYQEPRRQRWARHTAGLAHVCFHGICSDVVFFWLTSKLCLRFFKRNGGQQTPTLCWRR